jgi:hypothetical protein
MEHVSPLIQYFVEQGVPRDTVIKLLILPVIVTLIAFFRQVIGIKAFGIYTPAIVTFAFLETPQLKYGVVIFLSVILIGMLMRFVLKNLRILYLPRVAITLSIIAFTMLLLLSFGGSMHRTGLASVSIFPILIMITIVEKFVVTQIEKGNRTALILAVETLVISLAGYFLASWSVLINGIVAYPWIILFTIPINIFLGKWDGLRLTEYVRFSGILKNMR